MNFQNVRMRVLSGDKLKGGIQGLGFCIVFYLGFWNLCRKNEGRKYRLVAGHSCISSQSDD